MYPEQRTFQTTDPHNPLIAGADLHSENVVLVAQRWGVYVDKKTARSLGRFLLKLGEESGEEQSKE